MNISLSVKRIKHWGLKGGLGILDQGIYSSVNFLLSILLARWVSPTMYGGFSAAYSLFFLISNAQVALIAEPMSIYGANKYKLNVSAYLNYLLRLQWIGAFLVSFLFSLFALFSANTFFQDAIIGMAVALPFIFLYWYLRRAFYIEMQSGTATFASFIYAGFLILLLLLMRFFNNISSLTALLAMALSSLVASFFALKQLGLRFLGKSANKANIDSGSVNRELWHFGKWILPAYLAGWFTSMSFPFFILLLVDTQSAGAFRALQNLFLPFQQLLAAITLLLLPWLAKQKSKQGSGNFFAVAQAAAGVTGIIALVYCLLIVIFRHELTVFLYANRYYSSFDELVIFLAVSFLLGAAPLILGLTLRVLGHPNIILWSKGVAALFVLLLGMPMIWLFQMNGVIFSLIGSAIVEAFILLVFYFRIKKLTSLDFQ